MISDIIKNHVNVPDSKPDDNDCDIDSSDSDIDSEYFQKFVMEVPENRVKFIIGTNGDTIKDIQEKTSTDINKVKWKEDKRQCIGFLVVGPKISVSEAKVAIDEIVTQNKRRLCRYYLEGDCKNGAKCDFLHERNQLQKKKGKY